MCVKWCDVCDAEIVHIFSDEGYVSGGAFERYLVDAGIGWFAYVKFYVDRMDGQVKPLVVGKSGSLLVNSTGSDLNFSMDVNHCPARRFLHETGNVWYDKAVLIIRNGSEDEVYQVESELMEELNIFGS